MYWANIKGRFQGSSERGATPNRRIYLAMKYGNLWLSKVQLKKARKLESRDHSKLETNKGLDYSKLRKSLSL